MNVPPQSAIYNQNNIYKSLPYQSSQPGNGDRISSDICYPNNDPMVDYRQTPKGIAGDSTQTPMYDSSGQLIPADSWHNASQLFQAYYLRNPDNYFQPFLAVLTLNYRIL